MTKVYLATSGEYSDYRVRHVFTRREDAEAYRLADEVEERELHDGPVEVRAWHTLTWRPKFPDRPAEFPQVANPFESKELRDFDGQPGLVEHEWTQGPVLNVRGWDLRRVRKVYSEQRARYLAEAQDVTPP